tara:strand:- start:9773 stop:10345 length:573 start_codon:yes stop_codon:yes gene_type:complete
VNIPSEIRAGDTVKWRDDSATDVFGNEVKSDEWTLKYYLRFNKGSEAHTSTGSAFGTGWEFTISATDSAAFDAGTWYWQAVATKGSDVLTLGYGNISVEDNLAYTSGPGAYDGRTQVKKDLEAIQLAIRTLIAGGAVQEYKIGNRNLKRYDLPDLVQLEARYKAEVKREEQAELMANGLGNPRNMFVRFN